MPHFPSGDESLLPGAEIERLKKYSPHALVALFAGIGFVAPQSTTSIVQGASTFFLRNFDGATLVLVSFCAIFCIVAAAGPWGKLKIGGANAEREFSLHSWLAMLFAAGMGAGLVFWGAAEPLVFTVAPPPSGAEALTKQAIKDAYALTLFHWGLHAWAIYAVSALAIGYVAYGRDRALVPSAPLLGMPFLARRVIDWIALLAVTFGLVASVGQGIINMGSGAEVITGREIDSLTLQISILVVLTLVYLLSVWGGLKRGIQPLSNLNMLLAIFLAGFLLIVGPTAKLFGAVADFVTSYASQIFTLSAELRPEGAARDWTRAWSLTYFLWWIAWTPFVGVFIARISKGRTIREFILGVVLLPSVVTLIWFAVFGGTAVDLQVGAGIDLGVSDFDTAPSATYVVMAQFPFATLTQILTFLLIFIFLVTSADSGAFVLAAFSSQNGTAPPLAERIFWGVIIAVLTMGAIMSTQGQQATRALAVVGAIPLAVLMFGQAIGVSWQIYKDWRRSL